MFCNIVNKNRFMFGNCLMGTSIN